MCVCVRARACVFVVVCTHIFFQIEKFLWWRVLKAGKLPLVRRHQAPNLCCWLLDFQTRNGKNGLKEEIYVNRVRFSECPDREPVFPSRCLHVRMWLHKYMHTWTSGWPQVYIHLLHANSLAAIFVRVWVWIRSSQHCCLTHSIPSCLWLFHKGFSNQLSFQEKKKKLNKNPSGPPWCTALHRSSPSSVCLFATGGLWTGKSGSRGCGLIDWLQSSLEKPCTHECIQGEWLGDVVPWRRGETWWPLPVSVCVCVCICVWVGLCLCVGSFTFKDPCVCASVRSSAADLCVCVCDIF